MAGNKNTSEAERIIQKQGRANAFYANELELSDPGNLLRNKSRTAQSSSDRVFLQYGRTTNDLGITQHLKQFSTVPLALLYPRGPTIKALRSVLKTFLYTGALQNLVLPSDVTSIFVEMWGAGGGFYFDSFTFGGDSNNYGGPGAYAEGNLSVTGATALAIIVGKGGDNRGGTAQVALGGGGGNTYLGSASGGGFSAIRIGTDNYRVIVGGGGGGASVGKGGAARFSGTAQDGIATGGTAGKGGSQTAGGQAGSTSNAADGAYLAGGYSDHGGGGGGYYGGGGGGGASNPPGGGGSSLTSNLTGLVGYNGDTSVSRLAPNSSSSKYVAGVGNGGTGTSSVTRKGGDGLVYISYQTREY